MAWNEAINLCFLGVAMKLAFGYVGVKGKS